MLRSIRENIKGRMAKVILAIIIVPFVLFGAESLFTSSGGAAAVLTINGEDVTEAQLGQELLIVRNEMLARMGDAVDFDQLNKENLTPIAIERLLQTTLLKQAAKKNKMNAPDAILQNQIINMQAFQVDGKFSADQLNRILADQGLNLSFLKSRLADDIRSNQLRAGIALSSFSLPQDISLLVNIVSEERTIDWIKLPFDEIKGSFDVSSQELETYFEQHKNEYQTQLQATVEYIQLDLSKYIEPVSEELLEREYANQVDQFVAEERREVAHILLEVNKGQSKDQALAVMESIRKKLGQGEKFSDLAREYSQDSGSAGDGGSLGFTEKDGSFPEAFEKVVFLLEENSLSEVIETDAGLHLITVTDIEKAELASYQKLRSTLLAKMQQSEAKKRYVTAAEQLADIAFNAEDLQEPANELKLDIKQQTQVGRSGVELAQANEPLAFLSDSRVLKALFSDDVLHGGLNTDVIEISATQSMVLRVKDIFEPRQKRLEEVFENVNEKLITQKAQAIMSETVQRIKGTVAEGSSFTEALKKEGYTAESKTLSWQSTEYDTSVLNAVFSASREHVNNAVNNVTSATDSYLFQLTAIGRADENAIKEATRIFKQQVNKAYAQRDINAYFETLKQQADIQRF